MKNSTWILDAESLLKMKMAAKDFTVSAEFAISKFLCTLHIHHPIYLKMSNSSKATEKNVKTTQRAQIQSGDWLIWCWANWYNPLICSEWDKCLNIYQKNCLCHIKTQRHIFNWYYQSCVTKLDVGVFALQLLLSPSLIKFCSIYTLAWETDSELST